MTASSADASTTARGSMSGLSICFLPGVLLLLVLLIGKEQPYPQDMAILLRSFLAKVIVKTFSTLNYYKLDAMDQMDHILL